MLVFFNQMELSALSEDPKISSLFPTFVNPNALLHSFTQYPAVSASPKGVWSATAAAPPERIAIPTHRFKATMSKAGASRTSAEDVVMHAIQLVRERDRSLIIQFMSGFNTTNPFFFFFFRCTMSLQLHKNTSG